MSPLAALALAGCFVDVGHSSAADASTDATGTTAAPATATTADPVATTADATAAPTATTDAPDTTTTGPDPTTTGPDPTSATSATDPTLTTDPSNPTLTDPPGPLCGDGNVDPGEDCDDGNQQNEDDCLANCTYASCSDGYHNRGESDVDCGGPCSACAPCQACQLASDCATGLGCMSGVCNELFEIKFDWFTDCGNSYAALIPVATTHGGAWRIEAIDGGGVVSDALPPEYGWFANCEGFDFAPLNTEFIYDTPDEALASIDPKSIIVDYAGGPTRCGVLDINCDDNAGSSTIRLLHACQ